MATNNIPDNLSNIFSDAPLGELEDTTQMNTLYYPSELLHDHPNYIVFFLNENIAASGYSIREPKGSNNANNYGEVTKNKINTGSVAVDGDIKNATSKQINSNTQRTGYAIALYTPNDITEGMSFDWKQTQTNLLGGFTNAGGLNNAAASFNNVDSFGKLVSNLSSSISGALNDRSSQLASFAASQGAIAGVNAIGSMLGIQDTANQVGYIAGGYAVNPFMEVLFSGVKFREFNFNFIFAPTTEEESKIVKYIIKLFKYNSTPALSKAMQNSFFVYPGTFDIKYYTNGAENTMINRISTCALTNIKVSYTANPGNQFVTFKADGAPVMTALSLSFVELDMLNKDNIKLGF